MGARHRPYGRGILAVGPSLIGNGSYCEPRMPIGVAACAHRHEGAYFFLRIIAKARRHHGRQASAVRPRHIGSRPEPHRELVLAFLVIISMPIGALWPTLIGIKVHTFCALSPRLGGIMGARHRPYGRGILAVCPSLIGNGSYCEPRMPIGIAAYAHRHEGTSFLRIIAKARRHHGRQASAIWPSHIGSRPGPHREWVLAFLVIISMPIGVAAYAHRH